MRLVPSLGAGARIRSLSLFSSFNQKAGAPASCAAQTGEVSSPLESLLQWGPISLGSSARAAAPQQSCSSLVNRS